MKRNLLLLLCGMSSLTLPAQSYKKLWKEVEVNAAADKPRSALQGVAKIMAKATHEGNHNELLKAWISNYYLQKDISPDSALTKELPLFEEALKNETDTIRAAFYHSALAICYLSDRYSYRIDPLTREVMEKKATDHFKASLAHPEALARASAKDFAPLLCQGRESRWYGHDVLHILFETYVNHASMTDENYVAWSDKFISIYRTLGREEAVLHLSLEKWKRTDRRYLRIEGKLEDNEAYTRLMNIYKEFHVLNANVMTCNEVVSLYHTYDPEKDYTAHNDSLLYHFAQKAVDVYGHQKEVSINELTNFLNDVTTPSAKLQGLPSASFYPGKNSTLKIGARHAQQVIVRLTPLTKSRIELENTSKEGIEKLLSANKSKTRETVVDIPPAKPYLWTEQSVEITAPDTCGMYMIELLIDGKQVASRRVGVSRLTAFSMKTKAEGLRFTIVDRMTGHPVPHAQIVCYDYLRRGNGYKYVRQEVITTNEKGQAVADKRINQYENLEISYEGDEAAELFTDYLYRHDEEGNNAHRAFTRINLYTDRAIYRPGQKVQFSGVEYTQQADLCRVEPGKQVRIRLLNTQQKCIDTLLVTTDEYGAFSGEFTLPKVCLTGQFSLKALDGRDNDQLTFNVEEYKRPTITAETSPLETTYALGDSVTVKGRATTYSGVAIGGARVTYKVERSSLRYLADDHYETQTGEVITDADGRFSLPLLLTKPKETFVDYNRFYFNVSYVVTAENGETTEGQTTIAVGTKPAQLVVNVPQSMCRKQGTPLPPITPRLVNAAEKDLEGKGTYRIFREGKTFEEGEFQAGKKLCIEALNSLPQGEYNISFSTDLTDTDTLKFTLFDVADTHLANISAPLFFHEEKTANGVDVYYASAVKDAVVFVDIVADGKILKSMQDTLNGELRHIPFNYKEEYGDGATLAVCLVSNDRLYEHTAYAEKPQPDKRLLMKWTSFRSRLTPGSQEVWKLKITHPDGTAAKAQMMACLYDASLDALTQHKWSNFYLNFDRDLPYADFEIHDNNDSYDFSGHLNFKYLPLFYPNFSTWNEGLFDGTMRYTSKTSSNSGIRYSFHRGDGVSRRMYKGGHALAETEGIVGEPMASMNVNMAVAPREAMDMGSGNISAPQTLRKNFAETAFFRPHLLTDEKGEVNISFTLPESTTQWNFTALAHDLDMNNGRMDTTVVANKEFMAVPSLPRFLREGDVAVLPVNVTNLTNKPLQTAVVMALAEDETGKAIFKSQKKLNVEAGKTAVCTFEFDTKGYEGLLVCRTVAETANFSDGEEHYLPVLSRQTEVVRTLPFTLTQKGTSSWATDTLFYAPDATHKRLTIETVANPTWMAVMALPALTGTADVVCSYDWSTRLYALTLGHSLVKNNPTLLQAAHQKVKELQNMADEKLEGFTDNMPWRREANEARLQAKSLAEMADDDIMKLHTCTAIDKLRDLQDTEGAFAWYPGMRGNAYTTVDIATLLARIEHVTGYNAAHPLLTNALSYLQKEVAKRVAEMKKNEKQWKHKLCPTEWMMRYAYLNCIANASIDENMRFIIERSKQLQSELTIYGKAVMAAVMARAGKKEEAKGLIESILEHTSMDKHGGRFFDTEQAETLYDSCRIVTQCAAIEALVQMGHTKEADEMTTWLMMAKRTQMWETSKASADAVYALLSPMIKHEGEKAKTGTQLVALEDNTPLFFTLYNKQKIVAFNAPDESQAAQTVGYYKRSFNKPEAVKATSIKLDKRHEGLSWGCVYASFMTSKVETKGSGMSVERSFEVKQGTEWLPLGVDGKTTLKKGDIVRQTFCIDAETDYDFVELSANRPSCVNPRRPLSGFSWEGNLAAYRAVHDERTDFFIEKLSKGKHRFSEEYVVEKDGRFDTGIVSAKCVYAPEFNATAKSLQITSKQ